MRPAGPARPRDPRSALIRTVAATAAALAFTLGVYLLLEATRPDTGLVSFTFLLVLPAAVCGFVAYVADPWKTRTRAQYMRVPLWTLAAVVIVSLVFLREGVICILMLSPLWFLSGLAGVAATYHLRRRVDDARTYSMAVLALPLVAMQIEPMIPLPVTTTSVARTVAIDARPEAIWPLLRGIPDVHAGEGRWNLSQDVIGLPRPVGAKLARDGLGADRFARWDHDIRFRERITDWQAGRRIGWRFIFDDIAGWGYTDRHLMPDSPYFNVTTGGYRVDPLPDGRTRVTLHTEYRMRTPLNHYAQLWGELLLGDVEANILAVVKQRAERAGSGTSEPQNR
jgi:hypothetical protein